MVDWNSSANFDPFRGVQAGSDYVNRIYDQAARLDAGRKYAAGDTQGSAKAVAERGDIGGAQHIEAAGYKQQAVQQGQAEAAYEYIGRALPVFEAIAAKHAGDPDGGAAALGQAFDQLAPEIEQVTGQKAEGLAQFKQALVSDPKGTIQRVSGMLPVKYQTVGRDIVRQQGNNVQPVYQGERDAPAGYARGQDGKLQFEPNGPADPEVIKRNAEGRREVIINNPIPGRAGGDGGGYRLLTEDEKREQGLPIDSVYQEGPSGRIDRVAGNTSVRQIPVKAAEGIAGNRQALSKIDRAIAAIRSNPKSIGLTYAGPDALNQRMDPNGVPVRAILADIGSLKIHDRSGAAVTAAETPRLKPFIPSVTDTPEAAIAKLEQLKAEPSANLDEAENFYSPDNGYMSVPSSAQSRATSSQAGNLPRPKSVADALKLKKGTRFIDGNGVERIR